MTLLVVLVGSGIGQTLADICFGYIARYLHWEYVFYMTSACGAIWFVLWIIFVYDSPQQHPSIADDEKIYIETNLKQSTMSQVIKQIQLSLKIYWNTIVPIS